MNAQSNTPPDRVWLQWHGDGLISDAPVQVSEVTHSMEPVYPGDVEYVRLSFVHELVKRVLREAEADAVWPHEYKRIRKAMEALKIEP